MDVLINANFVKINFLASLLKQKPPKPAETNRNHLSRFFRNSKSDIWQKIVKYSFFQHGVILKIFPKISAPLLLRRHPNSSDPPFSWALLFFLIKTTRFVGLFIKKYTLSCDKTRCKIFFPVHLSVLIFFLCSMTFFSLWLDLHAL